MANGTRCISTITIATARRCCNFQRSCVPDESASLLQVQLNRLCFLASGARDLSQPIVMPFVQGDPVTWLAPYRAWRRSWFTRGAIPARASGIHAWQQIQINSAEDRLAFRYRDLPHYAAVCRKAGVKAIQLTGWHRLGQDCDGPIHDTDPRLGTDQESRAAIQQAWALGVEIVLSNKYIYGTTSTVRNMTTTSGSPRSIRTANPIAAPITITTHQASLRALTRRPSK